MRVCVCVRGVASMYSPIQLEWFDSMCTYIARCSRAPLCVWVSYTRRERTAVYVCDVYGYTSSRLLLLYKAYQHYSNKKMIHIDMNAVSWIYQRRNIKYCVVFGSSSVFFSSGFIQQPVRRQPESFETNEMSRKSLKSMYRCLEFRRLTVRQQLKPFKRNSTRVAWKPCSNFAREYLAFFGYNSIYAHTSAHYL